MEICPQSNFTKINALFFSKLEDKHPIGRFLLALQKGPDPKNSPMDGRCANKALIVKLLSS